MLLRGRFLETEPLEIGNPALVARAYESEAGCAVAAWNPTAEPQELAVAWPGKSLLTTETPSGPLSSGAPLPANDVAVMLFR